MPTLITPILTAAGMSAANAAIAANIIVIGGSVTYSAIQGAKMRNALKSANQQAPLSAPDPLAWQRLIYGEIVVTGTTVYLDTIDATGFDGVPNDTLLQVLALAGHECDSVSASEAWFNDSDYTKLTTSGAWNIPTGSTSWGATNPFYHSAGSSPGTLFFLETQRGTSTQGTLALLGSGGFDKGLGSNFKFRGIAVACCAYSYAPSVWGTSLPKPSFRVRGKRVYDPRDGAHDVDTPSTWTYSNNVALCTADFLRDKKFGKGIPSSRINWASVIEAANICDEGPFNRTAINVDAMRKGCEYTIVTVGTTDFTLLGASANTVGATFVCTRIATDSAVSTGHTGTVCVGNGLQEKRYEINGFITANQSPDQVLDDLCGAMAGRRIDAGGIWSIQAGSYRTPTTELTDDDLAGPLEVQTKQSVRDIYNGVKGTFTSPANNWTGADFKPVQNSTYLTEDRNQNRWKDVSYPFTSSPDMARRLANIDLESSRRQIVANGPYKVKALEVQPGDSVMITRPRLGWDKKVFDVISSELVEAEGDEGTVINIALSLKETASGIWTDSIGTGILYSPVITTQPHDYAFTIGGALAFSVYVTTGAAGATYQWLKDGLPISGATSSLFTKTGVASDVAEYRCVVTNTVGQVTSNPARATISVGSSIGSGSTVTVPDGSEEFFTAPMTIDGLLVLSGTLTQI